MVRIWLVPVLTLAAKVIPPAPAFSVTGPSVEVTAPARESVPPAVSVAPLGAPMDPVDNTDRSVPAVSESVPLALVAPDTVSAFAVESVRPPVADSPVTLGMLLPVVVRVTLPAEPLSALTSSGPPCVTVPVVDTATPPNVPPDARSIVSP